MMSTGSSSSRAAILTGLFGVLVFVGGLVGFINSASVMSFAFGLAFGLSLAVAAYLVSHPTTQDHGYLFSLVLLGALTLLMLYRYTVAWKFMPAGMVALLSAVLFAHNLHQWRRPGPSRVAGVAKR